MQLRWHVGDKQGNERIPERWSRNQQNGLDLGVFDVQTMRFLIKKALWLYAELCLLLERGQSEKS